MENTNPIVKNAGEWQWPAPAKSNSFAQSIVLKSTDITD